MRFFRYLFQYNIFIYILLGWTLVWLIYLIIKPRDVIDIKDILGK